MSVGGRETDREREREKEKKRGGGCLLELTAKQHKTREKPIFFFFFLAEFLAGD